MQQLIFLAFLDTTDSTPGPAPPAPSDSTLAPAPVCSPTLTPETLIIEDEVQDVLLEKESSQSKLNTQKQDELTKQIHIENEILVVLYKKKELNRLTSNDQSEIKMRKENIEKLKKKLKQLKQSRQRSQKYRKDRKRKLDSLDEVTRKKVTGKGVPTPGCPQEI